MTLLNLKIVLPANYNKLAVKCHWISKISENVRNLGFLKEKTWFFNGKGSKFAAELVQNGIVTEKDLFST